MSICNDIKNWDALLPRERLDVMQDHLARMALDYDVPVPEVVRGEVPGRPDLRAGYVASTNTIYMNQSTSEWSTQRDPGSLLESAGHEFAHELFTEAYKDQYSNSDEDRARFLEDSEAYAEQYAQQMADELADSCEDPSPPESPGTPDTNPSPWDLPSDDMAYA